MTRSPLLSTLIPLVPLAAMAWPLHRVINQNDFESGPEPVAETGAGPTRAAHLNIRSAHPYSELIISIGEANWRIEPEETFKEIFIPLDQSGELHITVSAKWPDDTPESAIFIELMPFELETQSKTIWGIGEVTEEFTFVWDLAE